MVGREAAQRLDRGRAVRRRALEVRDAAHDLDALVERPLQVLRGSGLTQAAVLRERDELEVDERFDAFTDVQERVDPQQTRIMPATLSKLRARTCCSCCPTAPT